MAADPIIPEPSSEAELSVKQEPIVVGIGASAGGLHALKAFLNHIPADSGLAVVVVVHLAPDHKSHLAELLQPQVPFPVEQVTQTMAIKPNHVYVIPPNANLSAVDTHLRLSRLEERRMERSPIDHFFRTLAAAHDGQSIAVILTGTGSDGTLGIREIKARGGLVIVQDPNEAEYDGMPQSAIATGVVDFILPVTEIPDAILKFNKTRPKVQVPKDNEEIEADERMLLHKVFSQLRSGTDRDFSHYKRSTVMRRITRRMQLNYLEHLPDYVERLRDRPEEVRALADDLLITVTDFFRDKEVFSKLEKVEIPRLFEGKSTKDTIRVWSVGCATGEEIYSLAILLDEEAARQEAPPSLQLFASDMHTRSLERARDGFYTGDIEADISPERLERFFSKENGGYRIHKRIRELVVFAPHNLLADPPFSRIDLISCRNLLIYLERNIQRAVIELFHYSLNRGGTLLLGSAESIEAIDLFRIEDKKLCIFRKRNVPPPEPRLPVFPMTHHRIGQERFRAAVPAGTPAYGFIHQQMAELYAPPSMLVSPDGRAMHFSEHAGRFLLHPGGEPTESAVKLVREELRIELQAAIHIAQSRKTPFDSAPIPVRFNGHDTPVILHVRPALELDREGFVLVIFEEREALTEEEQARQTSARSNDEVQAIEAELSLTRQRLQTIIEEYETSREEMKASNEEMQSTNEELRSTLEELETSKEELQSINEELQTVNQQNRHKVEELGQLTADLQNLLSATDIATLFLDREFRILRFTPKLGEIFSVRLADRGRPISDLTHRLGYPELRADAETVLTKLVPIEREVRDDTGHWYLTRVLPYRSSEDRIEGVVITFIDIDMRKYADDAVRKSEERMRRMLAIEVVSVVIFDEEGSLVEANDAFLKMTGHTRRDISRRTITWRTLAPPEFLELAVAHRAQMEKTGRLGPYETEYIRKNGSRSWMLCAGAKMSDGGVVEYLIDVGDRKRAEVERHAALVKLEVANDALQRANTDLKHFSYAASHDLQEPLRMVISYTQLLADEYESILAPPANDYIGYAVEGAMRMEALLNDLRDYWSVDETRVEELAPIEGNAILERSIGLLQAAIRESDAEITSEPLPSVMAEAYPLTLLFQNLISNAIKYRRERVRVKIHISARREAGQWKFFVTDNGMGIEQKHHAQIFAPFKRLHGTEIRGSGLGLAMCQRIVKRYGGTIWVESEYGIGSKFVFTLPAMEGVS